ncbi:hypothetical protein CELL_00064 [Cellulomonas sp. T2.31MG-18]|uniref:HNH endonuclease n=1 Tax=Cellulomonas sp. T2.31MG-18 TaxID=3157619 RepID=UPI0035F01023
MLNAWSCYSAAREELLGHAYDDTLGSRYAYDSNVVNHAGIGVGDIVVMRDRWLVFGWGVVTSIAAARDTKPMLRCPVCSRAGQKPRLHANPAYHCPHCKAEFAEPIQAQMDVTTYVAAYESTWTPFTSPAPTRALDRVYAGRDRQNAIRRLDVDRALQLVQFHGGVESAFRVMTLTAEQPIPSGRIDAFYARRIGQGQFRDALLERFDSVCAVTGPQPEAVLDAAHLASFAEFERHDRDAGLLLRADVHRLFDRLLLTIDPAPWTTHVAPGLIARYRHLEALDGVQVNIAPRVRPSSDLLALHHSSARDRWRELALN